MLSDDRKNLQIHANEAGSFWILVLALGASSGTVGPFNGLQLHLIDSVFSSFSSSTYAGALQEGLKLSPASWEFAIQLWVWDSTSRVPLARLILSHYGLCGAKLRFTLRHVLNGHDSSHQAAVPRHLRHLFTIQPLLNTAHDCHAPYNWLICHPLALLCRLLLW